MSYKTHLFICTNGGDNPEKCAAKGSEKLRQNLKTRCSESFGKDVRVNASGCLGFCEKGIAAVQYPKAEWYLQVTPTDEDRLFLAVKDELETRK